MIRIVAALTLTMFVAACAKSDTNANTTYDSAAPAVAPAPTPDVGSPVTTPATTDTTSTDTAASKHLRPRGARSVPDQKRPPE